MKNKVEEKIDSFEFETPSFDETWNKVDESKISVKKSRKPLFIGLSSGLIGVAAVTAITIGVVRQLNAPKGPNYGCEGVNLLRKPSLQSDVPTVYEDGFLSKLNDFSARFTDYSYGMFNDKKENLCVSPLSLYMATVLLETCASGSARQEILNALGMSHEDVTKNTKVLINNSIKEIYKDDLLTCKENLTNSIWLNPLLEKNDNCLDELANNFYCYPYEADFTAHNREANKAIKEFISENTGGLIDHDWDFGPYTAFLLMNTLYWKDAWIPGDQLSEYGKRTFRNADGSSTSAPVFCAKYIPGRAVETELYKTFYASTDSNYKLKFVLPSGTHTLNEIWKADTIKEINALSNFNPYDESTNTKYFTRCIFPEFTAGGSVTLKEMFREKFGINEVMDNPKSMSNITPDAVQVSDIIQETKLKVDKKGAEGAAVTIIAGEMTSVPVEKIEYCDLFITQSFGYILTDKNNVPLFTGVVNHI